MKADNKNIIKTDLTIIGSGMAGMASALFASNRGVSTVITGKTSSMHFTTGLMDLMGIYPPGKKCDDPWSAIDVVKKDIPGHPYAKISNQDIDESLKEMLDFLEQQKLFYRRKILKNVNIITSLGTLKKSYMIPDPMWNGVIALEKKAPSLLLDFKGMKIFSSKQIASSLDKIWTGLDSKSIDFPGMEQKEEIYPEHIARALDISENRIQLANIVKPMIKNSKYVGFPALLGMYKSDEAIKELTKLLGVPVFEIPTPPVSVPGIRLQEAFLKGFDQNELVHPLSEMVEDVQFLANGKFMLTAGKNNRKQKIESKAIVLATGRFLGKGLTASRICIKESLFNIAVTQPDQREAWHNNNLFNIQGHAVNRAGIEVDANFQPLTALSKPFAKNLFAAGSILAHCDWTRMKCGSGVAIATAFGAVKSFLKK